MRPTHQMKGVYAKVGRGGLEWMLWCHPDLLFVTSPLICPGPQVLVGEDSEQKSSLELASTEGAASLGKLTVRDYSWDQCGEHTVARPSHLD